MGYVKDAVNHIRADMGLEIHGKDEENIKEGFTNEEIEIIMNSSSAVRKNLLDYSYEEFYGDIEKDKTERAYIAMMIEAKVDVKDDNIIDKDIIEAINMGGFSFECKNSKDESTSLPFDFDAFGIDWHDNTLIYKGGEAWMFSDFCISEVYDETLEDSDFIISEITPKVLSETTKINEVYFDMSLLKQDDEKNIEIEKFQLIGVSFYDKDRNEYKVSEEVIADFNSDWKYRTGNEDVSYV